MRNLFFFILITGVCLAQDSITAGKSIILAIEHNYQIMLTGFDVEVAQNDLDYAIYQFFPSLNASLNTNQSVGNLQQTLRDTVIERNGAEASNQRFSVDLNWTIFDGWGRVAAMDIAKTGREQARYAAIQIVQNVAADVLTNYFNLSFQSDLLNVLSQNLAYSEERVAIAKSQYEVGRASKLDYLTAQVDFNADLSQLKTAQATYEQNLINFNFLILGRTDTLLIPSDSIQLANQLKLSSILDIMIQENPQIQEARVAIELNRFQKNLVRADFLPDVAVNSAYTFNRNTSEGFLIETRNTGLGFGFSVSVPIFNQMNTTRRYQSAEILIDRARIEKDFTIQNLQNQVRQSYRAYENFWEIMELETKNIVIAQENAVMAMERYKLGRSNALQLREAQIQLLQAENRRLEATLQTKLSEIELVRLSGAVTDNYR